MPNSKSVRSRRNRIARLIERDGCHCYICKQPLVDIRSISENKFPPTLKLPYNWPTVDHVIPKSKGGTLDMDNIRLACRECNNLKADRTLEEFCSELLYKELIGLDPYAYPGKWRQSC